MSEAAHPKGHEHAPGEHGYHFLEAVERSHIAIGDFGHHEQAPGDEHGYQHFLDPFESSGISEEST
jgi:hypothetical protein